MLALEIARLRGTYRAERKRENREKSFVQNEKIDLFFWIGG
jgi:hypothetical protein